MAKVNNDPGFTQLVKLNITDILLLRGVPIAGSATVVQRFTSPGTINSNTDLVFSTGTFTLVMPLINTEPLNIKSISGIATIDPGTNTLEGASTVPALASRVFFLDGTVWRDIS